MNRRENFVIVICLATIASGCEYHNMPNVSNTDPSIWYAIESKNIEGLSSYSESGGDLDVKSPKHGTPLRYAYELRHLECYESLLRLGADPDIVCLDGHIVTHLTALNTNPIWLRRALEAGADANKMNDSPGLSRGIPLYFAVGTGPDHDTGPNKVENVRLLVEFGANVNQPADLKGRSVLERASVKNEFEIVLYLLEQGADYLCPTPFYDDTFMSHMKRWKKETFSHDRTTQEWFGRVQDWLIEQGANPENAVWNEGEWKIE